MSDDLLGAVQDYVEANIGSFHEKRLATVKNKKLDDVLRRKNPYLFRTKNQTVIQLVYGIMDAFLSSQEETLFGEFLEGVASFVASSVFDARKPSPDELRGIDLVMQRDSTTYIVEIKSGPKLGQFQPGAKDADPFQGSRGESATTIPRSRHRRCEWLYVWERPKST